MIIISGPSTVGKNPLIYEACNQFNLEFIIPYTTRSIRTEEINGTDYFFLTKKEFQSEIKSKIITEWDYCLDNYYGYAFKFPGTKNQITHGLSRMALRIKQKYPDKITTVFLMPNNIEKIHYNLTQIYSGRNLYLRQSLVEEELCHSVLFDKVLICPNPSIELLENNEIKKIFDITIEKNKCI